MGGDLAHMARAPFKVKVVQQKLGVRVRSSLFNVVVATRLLKELGDLPEIPGEAVDRILARVPASWRREKRL